MHRSIRRFALTGLALSLLAWLPVLAETRVEKNLKLDTGGKLTIESDLGHVTVTGRSGSGAHIVMTAKNNDFEERFDVAMTELPGEVKVTVRKKKDLTSWLSWMRSEGVPLRDRGPDANAHPDRYGRAGT